MYTCMYRPDDHIRWLLLSPSIFSLRQGLSLKPVLTSCLDWLVRELEGPAYLSQPLHNHTWLFILGLGIRTQVFILVQQPFHGLSHLPSPQHIITENRGAFKIGDILIVFASHCPHLFLFPPSRCPLPVPQPYWMLFFPKFPHLKETPWHLSLWLWLILLNMMISYSIHYFANDNFF